MDGGAEFNNNIIKELLNLHKIEMHITTPYRHESNAPVERLHSTLLEMYRIVKTEHDLPPRLLMKYILIGYNETPHSTTQYKPRELINGHLCTKSPLLLNQDMTLMDLYMQNHRDRTTKIYEQVKNQIQQKKEQTINRINKDIPKPKVKPTDIVYLNKKIKNQTKSKPKNTGPYEVLEVSDKNIATIKHLKTHVTRANHLDNLMTTPLKVKSVLQIENGRLPSNEKTDFILHLVHDRYTLKDNEPSHYQGFAKLIALDTPYYEFILNKEKRIKTLKKGLYTITEGKTFGKTINIVCNKENCLEKLKSFLTLFEKQPMVYTIRMPAIGQGLFKRTEDEIKTVFSNHGTSKHTYIMHKIE